MKKTSKLRLIKDYKEELNYRILAFTLLIIIGCVLALCVTSHEWVDFNELRMVMISFISTVLSLAVVFVFWEVGGKRSFAKDILDLAKMSNNIVDSGIEYFYEDFKQIEWEKELKYKKNLKVAFSYGYTWTNDNRQTLEKFIEDGGTLQVFLPDYKDNKIISCLAERFPNPEDNEDYTAEDNVRNKIKGSIVSFKKLGATIYLYNGTYQSTYYLYDDTGIMASFNHKKTKSYVPAIKAKQGGQLFNFIKSEINVINEQSILWEAENEK